MESINHQSDLTRTDMKLSELYHERVQWIQESLKSEEIANDDIMKSLQFANEATDLAHCIAAFGDVDIEFVDHKQLLRKSSAWIFPGRYSWPKGLGLAIRAMREKRRNRRHSKNGFV